MKANGWNGKILNVDLTRRRAYDQSIDASLLHSYLGGRGLNVWILSQALTKSITPFSPENILVFGAGPFVGTVIPANGRYNVSSRSPLTGLLGDANSAGLWAPVLKKAGYDGVAIAGAADFPVYLWITEDRVEIRDASPLWGKTVSETDAWLRKEHGKDSHVSCIGPAGERLVRFAAVLSDVDRAAGRTGNGAVMGSKKLKAIVVKGKDRAAVSDSGQVDSVSREIRDAMFSSPSFGVRSQYGTPMLVLLYNQMGVLPTNNHRTGVFAGAERISGQRLKEKYVSRPKSCFLCPVHCSRWSEIREGKYAGTATEGPEFETMCALGSNLGNDDLESLVFLNRRLNDLGLDSISTGGVIAFAMECYETGLISRADTEGLEMTWGNTDVILRMVDRIAYREGLGDILAEGVKRASEGIPGSGRYALHVKGMEVPTQEVRGLKAWGLGWAVASRGADHCRAFPVMETTWSPDQARAYFGSEEAANRLAYGGKAAMVKWAEDFGAAIDALGICKIAYLAMGLSPDLVAKAYQAVTGMEMNGTGILKAGEKIINLERLLNLKLGLSPAQDTLPARFLEEPLPDGPGKGEKLHIDKMLREYYDLRGWDPGSGYPRPEKQKDLGLS
jgi:aldehyde:ferredoxin oxidoreductase